MAPTSGPPSSGPPTSSPVDPSDCAAPALREFDDTCEARSQCGERAVTTVCSSLADESWSCACHGASAVPEFTLGGTGDFPCQVAAAVCTGKAPLDVDSSRQCEDEAAAGNSDRCSSSRSCRYDSTLPDGLIATVLDQQSVSCQRASGGGLLCTCRAFGRDQSYLVDDADAGRDACSRVMEVCEAQPELVFDGQPACEEAFAGTTNQCELSVDCTESATVAEGIAAIRQEQRSAGCDLAAGEGSCTCAVAGRRLNFSTQFSGSSNEACELALAVCDLDLTFDGADYHCESASEDVMAGFCTHYLSCDREASAGEIPLTLEATLTASCGEQSDSSWSCTCASVGRSVDFAPEAADPCAEAVERCPALLDPFTE